MKLSNYSIDKPATIIIGIVAVVIFGFLSVTSMKQDLITPITMPEIMVYVVYPGASPVDIEQSITDPYEEVINQLSGVTRIDSESKKSVTFLIVTCDWDANLIEMKGEIESAVSRVRLPEGAFPPEIRILNSSMLPIVSFKVEPGMVQSIDPETGEVRIDEETGFPLMERREITPLQITEFLETNVVSQLKKIYQVATVELIGGQKEELTIRLDMDKVQAKQVSPLVILQILKYSNMNLPSGDVTYEGRFLSFRSEGKFNSIDDVLNMVIDFKAEEQTFIRLRDVADVSLSIIDEGRYVDYANEPIILLEIQKLPDGDTMKIIRDAKEIIDETVIKSGNLLSFSTVLDSSKDIGSAIKNVQDSAVVGALLAVIVIFLFLQNIRSTIIVGISIPLSVIMAFCMMKLFGLNLNLMSLGGMVVAIGMIVDSSIVVLDNIYIHFMNGEDKKQASKIGSEEVGGAVIASIATSLAVFIPILTLKGLVGNILKDVSATIAFALVASLVVSIMVVPFLSSLILKRASHIPRTFIGKSILWLSNAINAGLDKLGIWYSISLKGAVQNRTFVVILAIMILFLSLFSVGLVGFQFLDAPDMGEFAISVRTPSGSSMEETRAKMHHINDEVKLLLGENLQSGQFITGVDPKYGIPNSPTTGLIRLRLVDAKKRTQGMSIFEVIPLLQEEIPKRVPGVDIVVTNGGVAAMLAMAIGGDGYIVNVNGDDMTDLAQVSNEVARRIQEHPSVYKTEINVNLQEKELVSQLNLSNLGSVGVSPFEVAASQLIVFQGMEGGALTLGDEEYKIRLTSDMEGSELRQDSLNRIPIKTQADEFVTLAVLTDLVESQSADKIPHVNRARSITITGYTDSGEDIGADMAPVLESLNLPVGISLEVGGASSILGDTVGDLIVVFAIAVFLVYTVMVIQFQRFLQPLIIMGSIPFVFIGTVASLLISGLNLSLVAMLGVISLAGMVVNNAIVLVDYINLLRDKYNQPLNEAIINAGKTRLRPILMTTLTTVLGVVPMMFSRAEGSELLKPLGWVIFGGLLTSTIITLFLIPVLYQLIEAKHEKKIITLKSTNNNDGNFIDK